MAKYKYTPKTRQELKTLVNNLDIYLGDIDTQYITDMSNLFFGIKRENFNGIESWDTSNVTNMDSMFAYTTSFNQPIGGWNVSRVKNMASMFWGAISFNQPLDMWDVSNVIDMSWMFCHAVKFNQSLGLWDTRKVKNMSYMFADAYSFNQDIGNWNLSSVECMTNMFKDAKNFQFEQPVKYLFYNLDKNRSNTMQNGKIITITIDRIITIELKYNFYGSVERSDFFRKTSGYLCLYNFETRQIFSIPAKLNKSVKNNIDSDTSVCIDILINDISDMEMDLLSNPAVFGFCLTKNTDTVILSELEDILTAQFKTDYIKKLEQGKGSSKKFLYAAILLFLTFILALTFTGSLEIALIYLFLVFAVISIGTITSSIIINTSDNFNCRIEDEIAAIINDWKKYKQVPFLKRRYVDKKMKQLLQRIRQVAKQQEEKQNNSADTKIKKQKYNASSDKKIMISLNQLSNLFLISDNDLRNVCSETYKLCQMVNSIEELANKKYLKEYIEKRLDRIEQVLNIWKSANRVSSVSSFEMFNIKQKSIETIDLINNKLKEKIQNEIFLININLTSELQALQITENLR